MPLYLYRSPEIIFKPAVQDHPETIFPSCFSVKTLDSGNPGIWEGTASLHNGGHGETSRDITKSTIQFKITRQFELSVYRLHVE